MAEISNERVILSALIQNEEFARKVTTFLSSDYFHDDGERTVLDTVNKFLQKYKAPPSLSDLVVALKNDTEITEKTTEAAIEIAEDIFDLEPSKNTEYLIEVAEAFCADKAMFNAIQESILIYKGESKKTIHAIPELLREAMGVSFDTTVGSDYMDDARARFDYYKNPINKIPFDIQAFNDATNGGVPRKTLNLLAAGINVGKTFALVNMACMYMRQGLNVLYVTNEMREEEILNRMDANLMNVPVSDVPKLDEEMFFGKVDQLKKKNYGRLIVKEYPTGTCTAAKIRHDIDEIRLKRKIKIDVVVMDYIQIMTTASLRGEVNSYTKFKTVTEEIRALMMEYDMIGWTAAQFNRGGLGSTDPQMGDIGESTGIAATVDGMWALIRTEELDESGQLLVSELKSRYGNKSKPVWTVGVSIETQRIFDAKTSAPNFKTEAPNKAKNNGKPKRREESEEVRENNVRERVSQKQGNKFKRLRVDDE